jgi:formate dehydrogenase gamma subunit
MMQMNRTDSINPPQHRDTGGRSMTSPHRGVGRLLTRMLAIWGTLGILLPLGVLHAQEDCLSCHAPSTGLTNSQGQNITVNPTQIEHSVHAGFECLDCHPGAASLPHTAKTASTSCQTCHDDVPKELENSAHALLGDPNDTETCIGCHGTHDVKPPSTLRVTLCANCHDTEANAYDKSIHGKEFLAKNPDVPSCQSCHGPAHEVLTADDSHSPVNKVNLPDTCGKCHSNPKLVSRYFFAVAFPVRAYEAGVHGRAIKSGNLKAAACFNCHGVHDILPADDLQSTIWKQNVPATCGKCHEDVYKVYRGSVHGEAIAAGVLRAAACTDCHGEHRILAPGNPESPVAMANVSQATCSRCHANIELMSRFNVPTNRVPTYEESYHGLAAQEGRQTVANCASCHGIHNIYRTSDPRSTVNPANLGKTCGKCHPDAGKRFAIGFVHEVPPSSTGGRVLDIVKDFYLVAIPVILGLMFLHNLIDWWRKAKRTLAQYRAKHGPIRMDLTERTQHWVLLVTFIVLVISGFALKYPGAFWAVPILALEKHIPSLRGIVHRSAGALLIGVGLYHLFYLFRDRRGRKWVGDMVPKLRDIRDAVGTIKYNLGHAKSLPHYARFNYIEKAEYWALVWGTVIMAGTGILLWAHNWILAYVPDPMSVIDISTAIHFYEALLATFAIAIWHFYAVIFDPDVYPMKWTFLTGRAPEHEAREGEEDMGDGAKGPSSRNPGETSTERRISGWGEEGSERKNDSKGPPPD